MATYYESTDVEFLGQVAVWYYEDGLSQEQIAEKIGRSRSLVSRLLQAARELGLVSVRVRFPLRTVTDLEQQLVDRFNISAAHVLSQPKVGDDTSLARLGRLGARSLQRQLFSGVLIAMGWGSTLYQVVRAMPEIRLDSVFVVQSMGSIGAQDPKFDGSDLARQLADKLNGDFHVLSAPAIVESESTARELLSNRAIERTIDVARKADVLITGLGAIDSRSSGLASAGYMSEDRLAALAERGAVGDLLGVMLDATGVPLDAAANRCTVATPLDALSAIPWVVGVAGGAGKAGIIEAALRGGHLNELITDEAAAEVILERSSDVERVGD